MTDAEYEKLVVQMRRYWSRDREPPLALWERYHSCRDCDRADPGFYMVKDHVWRKAVRVRERTAEHPAWHPALHYGGFLCVECLEKRLGRRLVREDLADPYPPACDDIDEVMQMKLPLVFAEMAQ